MSVDRRTVSNLFYWKGHQYLCKLILFLPLKLCKSLSVCVSFFVCNVITFLHCLVALFLSWCIWRASLRHRLTLLWYWSIVPADSSLTCSEKSWGSLRMRLKIISLKFSWRLSICIPITLSTETWSPRTLCWTLMGTSK